MRDPRFNHVVNRLAILQQAAWLNEQTQFYSPQPHRIHL